jgi:GT2 family glycosyltransferase
MISVVVATRNRAGRLRALLDSLAAQEGPPQEVIVVDDASTDETPAVIAAVSSTRASQAAKGGGSAHAASRGNGGGAVQGIRMPMQSGAGAARNTGWRAGSGELVVFIDDDCVAQPGWLAALHAAHDRDPEAVVQGRTEVDPREAHRLGAFTRSQVVSGPGPWLQSCNIAYPRALLERLGGFDESFHTTPGEDTDLGWRAIEAGTRVVYEPAAVNWHGVHEPGALGLIRTSQRWAGAVRNVRNHPQLRSALHRGVFWKVAHERLLLAAAGVLIARKAPAVALAAALPYLALHRREHGSLAGTALALPAHVALDGAEVVAMLRGSASARTLVL